MTSPHTATRTSPRSLQIEKAQKRNKGGPKINDLSFHFKKLESKEQIEQEVSKRKEIMVRVEINDIEDR